MKQLVLTFLYGLTIGTAVAQTAPVPTAEPLRVYRAAEDRVNDMVNTKLEARFDYAHSYLYGKAWLTLKPHFYATDSLLLDAKGMDIKQVALVKGGKNLPLKYTYDGQQLKISLDRSYKESEQYVVFIDYSAKPDQYSAKGSAAITDAKGLYFINPRGEEKNKPTQIWTQGETEANSVWIPIIDKPNQKTTQDFYLTVPDKYVSLSNGKLVSQKKNADGTRTDYWKMELPHAPYLFFMGVGDYAIVKDSYKGKEVAYYVEKEYAPVARRIFGHTPEMMAFFSRITGVEYPWVKYNQIVGKDYVSGAMENTTATLHQESAQQDARELADTNRWERTIAHELFHQWFGDLVTSESWSNLTLNESFANYSEYLWLEYKYGKDAADEHHFEDMNGYVRSGSDAKNLVRFHYADKEDMFDAVSYNKGGRILHMLRNFVGDSAFFRSLNLYLTTNKFKAAEAQQLRLAFEEVTGKDLNWFWNQWYYGSGHPKLNITYGYDGATKQATVTVSQTQGGNKVFRFPAAVDVYQGGDRKRYTVWVDNKVDTFRFAAASRPDLVNFDAEKTLLAEKKENKTFEEYLFQFRNARNYADRKEALVAASQKQEEPKAAELMLLALKDPFAGLREWAIGSLDLRREAIKTRAESLLADIAKNDRKRTTKAAALDRLAEYGNTRHLPIFKAAVNDSSYTVSGNALNGLAQLDSSLALTEAKRLAQQPVKGKLAEAVTRTMVAAGDESSAGLILGNFEAMPFGQEKFDALKPLVTFLVKVKSLETFKRGVNDILQFKEQVPETYKEQLAPVLDTLLRNIQKAKDNSGQKDQGDYIEQSLKEKK
ncbi:M1 family metallopeptidase [Paraflavisolibacter sp. H34]|uniref:M1 family metallopeptidase n=1 Tax=Huijunlia imazamoxiresistens TaxID=3127457 RepID=UPI0030166FB2